MKKRFISFFLSLTLMVTGLVVPANASMVVPPAAGALAVPGGVAAGISGVVAAAPLAVSTAGLVAAVSAFTGYAEDHVQDVLNVLVSVVGVGNVGKDKLESGCNFLNQVASNPVKYSKLLYDNGLQLDLFGVDFPLDGFEAVLGQLIAYQSDLNNWHIINHQDYGHVIVNANETYILSDSIGQYPYYLENTDLWFSESDALKNTSLHVANDYMLDSLQAQQESLHPDYSIRQVTIRFSDGNRYKVIKRDAPGAVGSFILCDQLGFPYGIPEGNTQMGGDRDYNDDKEDQPEVKDEPIVDIDGDLVMQMFPDGSFTWINSVIYDAANKTYNVDASTSYNIENNTYYNYEWHYTYHIDYTSITYIGQTEEYDKYYEYYFDLPDGRSSADLTAEELLALNVAVDVLPYIRSADDVSIRALYHFDGDTLDSSYWSHLGKFKWNKGASITYMEAGAFEGALYLDENEHDFSIMLPSNIGSQDFTLQFRYYQSHTEAPVTDSYMTIGGTKLLQFDGDTLKNGSGTALEDIHIGSWQEIALVRSGSSLGYFLNGVQIGTTPSDALLGNEIRFVFGDEQQTYKYFDEFRVVTKALYSSDGYISPSVPFDTNLALVLPDSKLPVADEYWSFKADSPALVSYDFTSGTVIEALANQDTFSIGDRKLFHSSSHTKASVLDGRLSFDPGSHGGMDSFGQPSLLWNYQLLFPRNSLSYLVSYYGTGNTYGDAGNTLIPSSGSKWQDDAKSALYLQNKQFTAVFVMGDGSVCALPFTVEFKSSVIGTVYAEAKFDWGKLSAVEYYYSSQGVRNFVISLTTNNKQAVDILYFGVFEGDVDFTAEHIESVVVMDKNDLNTPSLAVRTDLEITGHQIGGVRPSLPEKGLVWAMVESGRITSLQIYNGHAWEQVDGRIWTGSRWVPYYAYDLLLLKDLYDIVESDPTLDYIYTEAGFWKWLQNAWGEMMKKLDAILVALGGSTGTSTDETLPGGADNPDTEMDEGWKFIDLLAVLRDGMWSTAKGVVSVGVGGFTGLVDSVSNVGSFFDLYEPTNPDGILGIFVYEGDDLWA